MIFLERVSEMGYRYYFYTISKDKLKEIEHLSSDELLKRFREDEEDNFIFLDNVLDKRIYEFGFINADAEKRIQDKGIPMFKNNDVQEELAHYKPYVIGKEGILEAITFYSEVTINMLKDLLVDDSENAIIPRTAQEKHIKGLLSEWEHDFALNLNEKTDKITSSWRIEYSLFELTRLCKTIDFDKETIVFCGW